MCLEVDPSKCVALPINIPQSLLDSIQDKFGFSWNSGTLQNLGIHLDPSLRLMYTHNYP